MYTYTHVYRISAQCSSISFCDDMLKSQKPSASTIK